MTRNPHPPHTLSLSLLPPGKCVTVQGTVVRVSNIKPLVTTMAFKCLLCQEMQAIALPDGKYQLPTKVMVVPKTHITTTSNSESGVSTLKSWKSEPIICLVLTSVWITITLKNQKLANRDNAINIHKISYAAVSNI
jgi:hypothetical protein